MFNDIDPIDRKKVSVSLVDKKCLSEFVRL